MATTASRGPRQSRRAAEGGARPLAAGNVVKVGGVALLLAALLNSESLLELAERQPPGSFTNELGTALFEPLHRAAELTLLDRPGEWIDDLRGLNTEASTGFEELAAGVEPSGPATATTVPSAGETPATVPAAPPTTPPPGPPSADNPLRIYLAGDSLAQGWGSVLQGQLAESDVYDVEERVRSSTGLTRPDYFNWPDALQDDVESYQPQVVVVTFGGNDGQPLKDDDGDYHDVGDPEWAEVYGARTGAVMDYLGANGRKLIWVGVPNAKSESLNQRMEIIRGVAMAEAEKRPNVTYVDSWALFRGANGGYAEYIVDQDGVAKPMRANDGYHMSFTGYERWARAIKAEIDNQLVALGGTPG
ncbi:MAG TPA: DUF459 domain-containing protein [Acidimicrobiales bacterium]|nr:DUF459 domain-containing protein [Acidimicrobiales bacterium]